MLAICRLNRLAGMALRSLDGVDQCGKFGGEGMSCIVLSPIYVVLRTRSYTVKSAMFLTHCCRLLWAPEDSLGVSGGYLKVPAATTRQG